MALSHAILAALLDDACSGYDLTKKFAGSVGFFWKASHQQMYRELGKLEAQGYLQAEAVAQSDRPNKKIYAVTAAGREYLAGWIAQAGEVSPVRDEMLVKVFAGTLVDPNTLIAELERHRSQHRDRLVIYQGIEKLYFSTDALPYADLCRYQTLKFGMRYEESWLAWCEEAIASLQAATPDPMATPI